MNCETVNELLPAVAGGDSGLDRTEASQLSSHLAGCATCTARLHSLRSTLSLMRRVAQSEPLPIGFAAGLHRRLAAEPAPRPTLYMRLQRLLERLRLDSVPRLGLVATVPAALALALVLVHFHGAHPNGSSASSGHDHGIDQEIAAAFRIPRERVAVVRFDFVADVEVQDVEFEVTLPNDLHFIDAGKILPDRKLVWRGSLSSGSNPIPLAVASSKPGRYRVTATARGDGLEVRHDILLEVVHS
jgi:hypothetical protein